MKLFNIKQTFIIGLLSILLPFYSVADEKTPQRGGTLVVHYSGEQRVLNPALRASTGVYEVSGKVVESLVDLDADGQIVPVLATSWTSSPDGKTITFKLREGVKWHDGKPFTSQDVKYNALEFWKKRLNFSTALQLNLTSVDTPDDHTVVFNYSRPMPLDLLLRALVDLGYVVPKHLYEGTDVLNNPYNTAPVGTGPFKFVEYQRGQHIIVERNPDYWRKGYPYLDKIIWRIINDNSSASAALESGQIDLSAYSKLSLADINRFKQNSKFEVLTKGSQANIFNNTLEFNFRNPIIANLNVRKAIVQSLDIPFFIDDFLYGFGKPATGIIPSSNVFYPKDSKIVYPFDREKAEQLLDEAGYPRKADGTRFTLKLVHINNGEDVPLFATFIQQSLAEVGINVVIVNLDTAGALNAVYKLHDFDIATGWHQYRGDPAVSTTVWLRSGSPEGAPWTNQYGWKSDAVDQLIDSAATEIDPVKRKALYGQLVDVVNTELPLWFATEREFISVINNKVHNHHNTARWPSSSWFDVWIEH
ncbi:MULTISPECIES: ABC transporter substrate-binding protein [unclassified Gilliamella]|uniref:ABC transporter substrate-binding protein n=1 Tax=unclassified Gilliamella TaxID=2685620 RepID=UPI00226A0442|nr:MULTISPECIES: ABC transporter substrate-binding protein [unclassified Gilliamella]MCX8596652.1 ABC transporter substrate-binding protein [Gilliamella sp. B3493]MCX8600031.1 ABC transporter substrate-binding protein [Gilliamella sp. B3486]MCX8671672.1 ABC transporter substrate-binding protein [Gilliamella sp. B2785]MCX8680000.1 ABC transporter substrate-binding protein [Gilliamella sp. B2865]MCX8690264.1 ABC transporter substrate-binding protein [Gilliamella sp. B2973]